jgi:hypothetical protein
VRALPLVLAVAVLLVVPAAADAHILTVTGAERAALGYATKAYPAGTGFEAGDCTRYTRHRLHCTVALVVPPVQACEITVRVRYTSHRSRRPRVQPLGGLFCDQ